MLERINTVSGDTMAHDLPTRYCHGPLVENKDGSLAIGFRIRPLYLAGASEGKIDQVFTALAAAINSLPDNYDGQAIYIGARRRTDLDFFDPTHMAPDDRSENPLVEEFNREIFDHLRTGLDDGDIKTPRVYLTLVRRAGIRIQEVRKRAMQNLRRRPKQGIDGLKERIRLFFTSPEAGAYYTEQEFTALADEIGTVGDAFRQQLVSVGIDCDLLDPPQIRELFYNVWQPDSYNGGGFTNPASGDDLRPILPTSVRTSLEWDPTGQAIPKGMFRADGVYHALMTVLSPPEDLEFPLWQFFIDSELGKNLAVFVNFRQGDLNKRKKKLHNELKDLENQLPKKPELQPAYEQVNAELMGLGEGLEKTWEVTQAVHVWDTDPSRLKAKIRGLHARAETKAGMLLSHEEVSLWEYWRVIQPFWAQDKDRYRDLGHSTSQLVASLPLVGEPDDRNSAVGAVYTTFTGGLFNFFPCDAKNLTNYNGMILGGSGSGKSFYMTTLAMQLLKRRCQVILVDVGRSFESLTHFLGGLHIDLDPNKDTHRLNCMQLGEDPLSPDQLTQKMLFVQELVSDEARPTLTSIEQSAVTEALKELIHAKRTFYLSDLVKTLSKYTDKGGKELSQRLEVWCNGPGGIFGNLFDGPSSFALSTKSPLITFEMQRLMQTPKLGSVMLVSLINYIQALALTMPGLDKYLIFDEAAVFLKNPNIAKIIEILFRTARKSGISMIGISQGIKEWAETGNRDAITKNLNNMVFLKQDSAAEIAEITEAFGLGETAQAMLGTLQTVPGHYSQAMIGQRLGNGELRCGFINNITTPIGYALATTNPKDREMLRKFQRETGDRSAALLRFAKEFPNGVIG